MRCRKTAKNVTKNADFDSYWEYEAKNKNRNRIRVGRQYQATIPPLLKPGDKDGRRFEDLETLKWKPDQITDSELEEYLSMAKSITSFSRALRRCRDSEETDESTLQAAIKGLATFVTSHHPCHQDTDCKVPVCTSSVSRGECLSAGGSSPSSSSPAANEWSPYEAHLFSLAVEACGKNFCTIKKEYLPWKPVKSLIEYYYSNVKPESPPLHPQPSKVPSPCNAMEDQDEPVPSCSHTPDDVIQASCPKTKEAVTLQQAEGGGEEEADASDSQVPTATIAATASSSGGIIAPAAVHSPEAEPEDLKQVNPVDELEAAGPSQATVGSLKFFLGGRLVLKLNAQQDNISGTRCQWVQSNDTPKHPYQAKKLKHKKKSVPETSQQVSVESPTPKKKADDDSNATSEDGSPAAKKPKTHPFNPELEFPPLCSASWTPPVADGQESVELDDASSKTSEGCVSPVVFGPRGPKSEVRTETPVDHKLRAVDQVEAADNRNAWLKAELMPATCNSQSDGSSSENYMPLNSGGSICENMSPKSLPEDSTYSHEVLNHKSALPHSKSATFYIRASRSGSPSAKLFNKRPSPCDFSERGRSSSGFQSPTIMPGGISSDKISREVVLDLSSRLDQCRSKEISSANFQAYAHISPTRGIENCSSSEGSPHTPSSVDNTGGSTCCKSSSCTSSNCLSCRKVRPQQQQQQQQQQVPNAETKDSKNKTCRKKLNVCQTTDANGAAAAYGDSCCSVQDMTKENCDCCTCCSDPSSSSCASSKCNKIYLSQDQVCNKEGQASRSPSQNSLTGTVINEESCPQKLVPWYGGPTSSLFQYYPNSIPYYIAYGVNPVTVPDPISEVPLDLSSSANSKRDRSSRGNVPEVQAEIPKNAAADAVDRGMLYQLLKNKVTK